jgi:hypothetical protein
MMDVTENGDTYDEIQRPMLLGNGRSLRRNLHVNCFLEAGTQPGNELWCRLSSITFDPHCSLREIRQNAFSSCALKSFCVPDSGLVIDWSCFSKCREVIDISFESPSKTEQIMNFNRETNGTTSIPDSVKSMTVGDCGRGGFVCIFGRDSRLQDLQTRSLTHKGVGFLGLTESSMKRIRNVNEWRGIGRGSEKSIWVGSCMNFPFWLIRSRDVSCRHYQHSPGVSCRDVSFLHRASDCSRDLNFTINL